MLGWENAFTTEHIECDGSAEHPGGDAHRVVKIMGLRVGNKDLETQIWDSSSQRWKLKP